MNQATKQPIDQATKPKLVTYKAIAMQSQAHSQPNQPANQPTKANHNQPQPHPAKASHVYSHYHSEPLPSRESQPRIHIKPATYTVRATYKACLVLVSKLGDAPPQGCVARATLVKTSLALREILATCSTKQKIQLPHTTKELEPTKAYMNYILPS